ncbi:MAG: FdtA/QdtA family cupin domain-containing protein [Gemmatimonadaceae bacterium]
MDHHTPEPRTLRVRSVTPARLPVIPDARGSLSFAETGTHLPFTPQRYFLIYGVREDAVRGEHAHRALHQYMVCVHGACTLALDDGAARDEIVLDSPGLGLHIPPMLWTTLRPHSPEATILVLASDVFEEADYIRDYDEFLRLVRAR